MIALAALSVVAFFASILEGLGLKSVSLVRFSLSLSDMDGSPIIAAKQRRTSVVDLQYLPFVLHSRLGTSNP